MRVSWKPECRFISSSSASAATRSPISKTGSSRSSKSKKKRGQEARAHPHHPHGAQARRGTDRRRLALLGDPRPDHVPRAHPRHPAVHRQRRHRPLPRRARSANACWSSRARARRSRAGAISRTRKRRAICRAQRRAPRRCRSRCGANCANWGCCSADRRRRSLSPRRHKPQDFTRKLIPACFARSYIHRALFAEGVISSDVAMAEQGAARRQRAPQDGAPGRRSGASQGRARASQAAPRSRMAVGA